MTGVKEGGGRGVHKKEVTSVLLLMGEGKGGKGRCFACSVLDFLSGGKGRV